MMMVTRSLCTAMPCVAAQKLGGGGTKVHTFEVPEPKILPCLARRTTSFAACGRRCMYVGNVGLWVCRHVGM